MPLKVSDNDDPHRFDYGRGCRCHGQKLPEHLDLRLTLHEFRFLAFLGQTAQHPVTASYYVHLFGQPL